MNIKMISRVLGLIMLLLAALLILPLIAGLCYGESVLNFVITIVLCAAFGGLMLLPKVEDRSLFARDGLVIVGFGWLLMSLFGALPFVLSGDIPNYIDAVFETASGLSTTGSSILTDIEAMSRGCMFWRLFTHWIGGMGVLVFIMAVLPMNNEFSMHIMRAEVPGPTVGKLVPKVKQTAKILYIIYIALTVLEAILLLCGGMSFYEAILHAFATAGTGGFSTRAASIAAFDSVYIEMVISVFMMLFGLNFNLYYLILIGKAKDALKNEELHWYLAIIASFTLIFAFSIRNMYGGFLQGLRYAFFNVNTVMSTCGFGTVDFVQWPEYCKWMLVLLMLCGGCAGSTGGGMKLSRIMMLLKSGIVDIRRSVNPRLVSRVNLDRKPVPAATLKAVRDFALLYFICLFVLTFIISFDGYDITTNFTAAISCLSNIGPGMGLIGPTGGYAIFSHTTKAFMAFAMLLGRLEIYPLIIILSPSTWKR